MSWMDDLKKEATSSIEGRIYQGPTSQRDAAMDIYEQLQGAKTETLPGARPQSTDFLTVTAPQYQSGGGSTAGGSVFAPNVGSAVFSDPSVGFDQDAYLQSTYDWMRNSEHYSDWSDDDIRQFAAETAGASDTQRQAQETWMQGRIGWEQARDQGETDRNHMLSELEAFKANWNEAWIGQTLSREKQYWDQRKGTAMQEIHERAAQSGTTLSPYVTAELGRRYDAQAADAIQVRRSELEMQKSQMQQYYLSMLNGVYSNTDIQSMDPQYAAGIAQALGTGAAA